MVLFIWLLWRAELDTRLWGHIGGTWKESQSKIVATGPGNVIPWGPLKIHIERSSLGTFHLKDSLRKLEYLPTTSPWAPLIEGCPWGISSFSLWALHATMILESVWGRIRKIYSVCRRWTLSASGESELALNRTAVETEIGKDVGQLSGAWCKPGVVPAAWAVGVRPSWQEGSEEALDGQGGKVQEVTLWPLPRIGRDKSFCVVVSRSSVLFYLTVFTWT